MIYFLVNNDYQLLDAQQHALQLREAGRLSTPIRVPHALQLRSADGAFEQEVVILAPAKGRRWLAAWLLYRKLPGQLDRLVHARPEDTLIVYTEYELTNHFLINRFKASGATVLIMEDGGVGTYLPFAKSPSEPLSLRERIIAAMTRWLPGLGDTHFHKLNGVVFPWRPVDRIDALCVYRHVDISRSIPVQLIAGHAHAPVEALRPGRVLFLNECIYDHYQDDQAYMVGLDRILASLTAGYPEVFFKFHPRENEAWRARISALLKQKHPLVHVVQENMPVESLLQRYAPEALASYFSTTLLNLEGSGIQPLYLYHLIDDLADKAVFRQMTQLLSHWNYRFVEHWDDVKAGYEAGLQFRVCEPTPKLADVIDAFRSPAR